MDSIETAFSTMIESIDEEIEQAGWGLSWRAWSVRTSDAPTAVQDALGDDSLVLAFLLEPCEDLPDDPSAWLLGRTFSPDTLGVVIAWEGQAHHPIHGQREVRVVSAILRDGTEVGVRRFRGQQADAATGHVGVNSRVVWLARRSLGLDSGARDSAPVLDVATIRRRALYLGALRVTTDGVSFNLLPEAHREILRDIADVGLDCGTWEQAHLHAAAAGGPDRRELALWCDWQLWAALMGDLYPPLIEVESTFAELAASAPEARTRVNRVRKVFGLEPM